VPRFHLGGRFTPPLLIAAFLALLAASPADAHDGADTVLARPAALVADAPLVAVSGTVIDLVVEDRVSNKTLRYVALRLDDGQSIALVGSGLENLPTGARAEAIGRSAGDTLFVTDTHPLPDSRAPSAQVKQAPTTTQVEGTLTIVHADDFAAVVNQMSDVADEAVDDTVHSADRFEERRLPFVFFRLIETKRPEIRLQQIVELERWFDNIRARRDARLDRISGAR